jgi:hypothetical protein
MRLLSRRQMVRASWLAMAAIALRFPASRGQSVSDDQGGAPGASGHPAETVARAAGSDGPIPLGAERTRILLTPAPAARDLRSLVTDHTLYLIVDGLTAEAAPRTLYNLYLDLPDGAAAQGTADPHFVGALSFFGVAGGGTARSLAFNVTALIRDLQTRGVLGDTISVTIVPSTIPAAGAKPALAEIRLIAR